MDLDLLLNFSREVSLRKFWPLSPRVDFGKMFFQKIYSTQDGEAYFRFAKEVDNHLVLGTGRIKQDLTHGCRNNIKHELSLEKGVCDKCFVLVTWSLYVVEKGRKKFINFNCFHPDVSGVFNEICFSIREKLLKEEDKIIKKISKLKK